MTTALPPNKHQEKSLRTRTLLLDAAIDCLADTGYGNISISDIAKRAGVTRGAQAHHFHTRAELFAHAIDHLAARQRAAVAVRADGLDPAATAADVLVELISAAFANTLGKAAVELYGSFASDEDLRQAMIRAQRDVTADLLQRCVELIGPEYPRDRLDATFWLTINVIRGATAEDMLGRSRARREHMLQDWRRLAAVSLQGEFAAITAVPAPPE